MEKGMFVWRKSVYDNNFKCNQCGTKLFNTKIQQPTDNLVVNGDDTDDGSTIYCYCGKCQNAVATYQTIDGKNLDDDNVLQGNYSEWIEKKAMDIQAEMQKRTAEHYAKKYEQKIKDLEDKIASRDATIKKLKETHAKVRFDKDKKIQDLWQEIEHLKNTIAKLEKQEDNE